MAAGRGGGGGSDLGSGSSGGIGIGSDIGIDRMAMMIKAAVGVAQQAIQ